jgi:hypothetical protein
VVVSSRSVVNNVEAVVRTSVVVVVVVVLVEVVVVVLVAVIVVVVLVAVVVVVLIVDIFVVEVVFNVVGIVSFTAGVVFGTVENFSRGDAVAEMDVKIKGFFGHMLSPFVDV